MGILNEIEVDMKTTSKKMAAVIVVVMCSFLSLYSQSNSEFYYEGLKEIQSDTCSCMVKYYMDSASRKIVESKEYRAGRLVFKGQYSGKIRNVYHYEYDTLGRICYFYSTSTDGRSYTTHGYVIYDQMRFRVVSNYLNNLYFVDILEDSAGYRMAISINNKLVDSAKMVISKRAI